MLIFKWSFFFAIVTLKFLNLIIIHKLEGGGGAINQSMICWENFEKIIHNVLESI